MKNDRIAFRLSAELRAKIEGYAKRDRRTVSDWVQLALEERVQQLDELADAAGIGVDF
jgi:predicted DNA-binding protein